MIVLVVIAAVLAVVGGFTRSVGSGDRAVDPSPPPAAIQIAEDAPPGDFVIKPLDPAQP